MHPKTTPIFMGHFWSFCENNQDLPKYGVLFKKFKCKQTIKQASRKMNRKKWDVRVVGKLTKRRCPFLSLILSWSLGIMSRKIGSAASLAAFQKSIWLLNFILLHSSQGCLSLLESVEGIITVWQRRVGFRQSFFLVRVRLSKICDAVKFIFIALPFLIFGPLPYLSITSTTKSYFCLRGIIDNSKFI